MTPMSPIGTTRQFNGVVSNDAFGARAAVAVDYSERRLWFGDPRSLVASGTAGPGSKAAVFFRPDRRGGSN